MALTLAVGFKTGFRPLKANFKLSPAPGYPAIETLWTWPACRIDGNQWNLGSGPGAGVAECEDSLMLSEWGAWPTNCHYSRPGSNPRLDQNPKPIRVPILTWRCLCLGRVSSKEPLLCHFNLDSYQSVISILLAGPDQTEAKKYQPLRSQALA